MSDREVWLCVYLHERVCVCGGKEHVSQMGIGLSVSGSGNENQQDAVFVEVAVLALIFYVIIQISFLITSFHP